ncbi:MAG: UDP-N-acetylglucosamine 2-epimerase (non-hydrolyzing) [Clostridia bacterium]|nr:UDP-N-acetylglucosamine 2-epimerase (non-hydrolyzing) [Clostridia bacterium]
MKKIQFFIGTRPEATKLCPLVRVLKEREGVAVRTCVTGQHRDLLAGAFDPFGIFPDEVYRLPAGLPLSALFARVFATCGETLGREMPHAAVVQGDTLSATAAALAAFYRGVPVFHVEAGLRTYADLPYPEEAHRRMIAPLARLHFAPTAAARENLLREGIPSERIFVTGNTGLDALRYTLRREFHHALLPAGRLLLLTLHRRESIGAPMEAVFSAVRRIVAAHPDVTLVFPLHKNAVGEAARRALADLPRVVTCEALPPAVFANLLARATLVLTDSGGVCEEASFLHIPTLILRAQTERTEAIAVGAALAVGTDGDAVFAAAHRLICDPAARRKMENAPCPYGDGHASERIADAICKENLT